MPGPHEQIDPLDDCEWVPAREIFRRLDFEPNPSSELDDFQLRGRLWEFIYAMAGHRFYLCHTDHHSDRRLYTWLSEEWLDQEVADIPPEAEINTEIDASDFGNGLDPIIWLRYFATEKEREEFAREHSLKSIPAHEKPQCDRDRWLPEPPGILPEIGDEEPFPFDDALEDNPDPLGLAAIDSHIRGEQDLEARIREHLANTGAESEGWQRPIDRLRKAGSSPIPPDELTDETLTAKLWELLHNLAQTGFYVLHTDHLSDRELYCALWQRGLRDEACLSGKNRGGGWFHDFIGSGSDDDNQLWLRYYADDEERAEEIRDWSETPIPPKEKPPFNRDWRLPKGPF